MEDTEEEEQDYELEDSSGDKSGPGEDLACQSDCDYVSIYYESRTVNSYKKSLTEKKNKKHHEGVEFDSEFNRLRGFHVSGSHDHKLDFEGVLLFTVS